MNPPVVSLSQVIRVHYGAALKEAERHQAGRYEVFGSSGTIGRHDEALFDYPSIVIGRKGSVGAVTYAPRGGWAIDTAFFVERLQPKECELRYLYYALVSANLARHTITTSIPGLSRDDIYSTRIPLPSPQEQRRIADILDRAETLSGKRREALALTDDLLRSAFLEIFGDPVTNPNGWEVKPLGTYLGFVTSGSRGWAEHYTDQGERFIRSLDVQMDRISDEEPAYVVPPPGAEAERTRVRLDDVLLTITGSKIGRAARATAAHTNAYVSQHVAVLRLLPGLDPDVVTAFLVSDRGGQALIARTQYGQTKPGLNLGQIRSFPIPVPPPPVQARIRAARTRVRSLQERLTRALQSSDELFDSLVQRAFGRSLT